MKTIQLVAISIFIMTADAGAALYNRGGGLIYDSENDVTWIQDASYIATSQGVTGGYNYDNNTLDWSSAMAFTDSLSYYDSERNTYWEDWRLPDPYMIVN